MSNQNPVARMTNSERNATEGKTKQAIRYNEFVSLGNPKTEDAQIMQMDDADFSNMTKAFATRNDFISAVFQMKRYLILGKSVPDELWNRIEQVRKDYKVYLL